MRRLLLAGILVVAALGPTTPAVAGRSATVIDRVDTTRRVAFITIDDGYARDPRVLTFLRDEHVPVTAFLTEAAVSNGHGGVDFFRQLRRDGGKTEDHTVSHPRLVGRPLAQQKEQICAQATQEERWFGKRPRLFRPPYGAWDDTTREAAAECGMTHLVLWTAVVKDQVMTIQGPTLEPGMIILLHWHAGLLQDLQLTVERLKADHLTPVLLEDYL